MKNIEKNNKLIAEFLGYEKKNLGNTIVYYQNHNKLNLREKPWPYRAKDMLFHCDWNWIMRVVEKIKEIALEYDEIIVNNEKIYLFDDFLQILDTVPEIHKTYGSVVEFIKNYNKNLKK